MIDITFPSETTLTKCVYGYEFPATLPVEEMDTITQTHLMFGFPLVYAEVIPDNVGFGLTQGQSVEVHWSDYTVTVQDDIAVLTLHNLIFDGFNITFLAAYMTAVASSGLLLEAGMVYDNPMNISEEQQGFVPVFAMLVGGDYCVSLKDVIPVDCFLN